MDNYRALCHKYLEEIERQDDKIEVLEEEINDFRRGYSFPHMCQIDHMEIGHADSGEDERCPLCRAIDEIEHLKAFISDRIHDATREEMLMEVDYHGQSA